MEDIEIARNTKLEPITKIAEGIQIKPEELEQYGKYKAKISPEINERLQKKQNGKLILMTEKEKQLWQLG